MTTTKPYIQTNLENPLAISPNKVRNNVLVLRPPQSHPLEGTISQTRKAPAINEAIRCVPPIPLPKANSSEIISECDAHIATLLKRGVYAQLSFMDREDLTQQVRIKIMDALREKTIYDLHAYLRSMLHNEYISHIRRQKAVLPLLLTNEGEIQGYSDQGMIRVAQGWGDPQVEVEQANNFYERLEMLVPIIVTLPAMQKRAAICVLRDRMNDPLLLAEAFKPYNLDISTLQWPSDPKEKRRLQASYSPVRRKLARAMHVDLTLFKAKGPLKSVL